MPELTPIPVPKEFPNDESATLVTWLAEDGAEVSEGTPIATLETTKSAFDVASPHGGFLRHGTASEGDELAVGTVFAYLTARPGTVLPAAAAPAPETAAAAVGSGAPRVTRKALRLLREHGLSPRQLGLEQETIAEADVRAYLARNAAAPAPEAGAAESAAPAGGSRFTVTELPAEQVRLMRALERQQAALVPSRVVRGADFERARAMLAARQEEHGAVTLGECVVHAAARCLGAFPRLNAFYADGRLYEYRDVHIGYVLNMGDGLRVPVLRGADRLDLPAVAARLKDFALAYLRRELGHADCAGGTFTVTDLHGKGVTSFDPVINLHQSAILGIGAPSDGERRFNLILTFDHRIADGNMAADFLAAVEEALGASG